LRHNKVFSVRAIISENVLKSFLHVEQQSLFVKYYLLAGAMEDVELLTSPTQALSA
jgi:hypothetical protein